MTVSENQPRTESLTVTQQRALWLRANHGVLAAAAREFGVSYTSVRRVFAGDLKSAERRIERFFHERGCPGFEEALCA